MELLAAASILGIGYMFSNSQKINRNDKKKFKTNVLKNQKPSGNNIYSSKRSFNIRNEMQEKADKLFEKSRDSINSNVMIAGPPEYIINNKVDFKNDNLPIEFNRYAQFDTDVPEVKVRNNTSTLSTGLPISGGFNNIIKNNFVGENKNNSKFLSLTGEVIDSNEVRHNNMVPFFGGNVKQNVDDFGSQRFVENFTGNIDNYQEKKEIEPMFKPMTNMSNVYGSNNFDNLSDRYYVSNIRNNISPTEQIRVGPGLNQGFTATPSGGFQQSDTRDFVLPPTTDEIRVRNNPRVSYHGRIIPGQKIAKPGKIGAVQKASPPTDFTWGADRLFTTTGNATGPTERPDIVMRYVNRKSTELKKRIGPAAPTRGTQENRRPNVQQSNRQQFKTTGPRNNNATSQWTIPDNDAPHDYGKDSIKLNTTIRQKTGDKTVVINKTEIEKKPEYRNNQKLRISKKTNVIGNPRQSGNVQGPHNRSKVYDPNDVAKTTIKETNIHNNRTGAMSRQAPNRSTVYDPNDIARTTIKETNIHDNRTGAMSRQAPERSTVYDPNDIARTTIKETNIHDNRTGAMGRQAPERSTVYDPNDIAKTTIKETNIHDNRTGNYGDINPPRSTVYDPDDIPKTTNKETTIINDNIGNTERQQKGTGYHIRKMEAEITNREIDSGPYTGNPEQATDDGYRVANVNAEETNRQFQSVEYEGIAAPSQEVKPISYTDIYNATISSIKDQIAEGRVPNPQGDKEAIGAKDINATTFKNNDQKNNYLNERGVQSSLVYNSIPEAEKCSVTTDRQTLPNEIIQKRLNESVVEQFKSNPFTQSLESYAFP